jgi:hypothetical protein
MGKERTATLYAESADGVMFLKPNLGVVSWNGSSENNIVLDAGAMEGNRGVFLDLHGDTNTSRRFKLFGGAGSGRNRSSQPGGSSGLEGTQNTPYKQYGGT